ncbi:MAG: hypothetical protein RIM72_21450 [Alphaproteobacteria bacterium]
MTAHPDLTHALDAVRRDPDDTAAWRHLGLMIAAHGAPAHLQQAFGYRQAQYGDAAEILFRSLFDSDLHGNKLLRDRIVAFADHCPDDETGAVMRFFAGCIRLCHDDPVAGAATLNAAATYIAETPAPFETTPHLIKAPVFARMALPPQDVSERLGKPNALQIPAPIPVGKATPAASDRWVFASCDSRYFAAFADRFFAVAGTLGPIHLHVVNPTADQQLWMESASAPDRQFSIEEQETYLTSPYYASNRFFHLPGLIDRYGSEILMLDIDLEALMDIETALDAMGDADVGYFAMPTVMPWLRHHAAVIRFRTGPQARRFADDFQRLLQSMLTGSSWFVDQMCFLNMVNAERMKEKPMKIRGLEAGDGYSFSRFVLPAGEDDTKSQLRMQAGLSV